MYLVGYGKYSDKNSSCPALSDRLRDDNRVYYTTVSRPDDPPSADTLRKEGAESFDGRLDG